MQPIGKLPKLSSETVIRGARSGRTELRRTGWLVVRLLLEIFRAIFDERRQLVRHTRIRAARRLAANADRS